MKFSKTILSTLLLASTATFASTYNGEVGLKYADNGFASPIFNVTAPIDDFTSIQLHGTYNFSEVNTAGKPLAESAFLGKHSYIRGSVNEYDIDGGDVTDTQTIGAGFYIPNSIFYIGVDYINGEDTDDTRVELGITPIDGLLITTGHTEEADDYEPNVMAKYVRSLAGDTAINLEGGFFQGEDGEDDELYAAADYYFTNFFSVGGQVYDYGDGSIYSVRTRYFFNDSFSLNGELASDNETDDNSFSIGASLRF